MKCFLYCRKSSESDDKQAQSIESQKMVMSGVAQSHGLTIVDIITEDKSASKPYNRTGFDELIRRIKKKEASVIVTWKIDRLSRNQLESGIIGQALQDGVIQKIVTIEKTFTPKESQILFSLENAMASEYSRNLSMNVKRGQQTKLDRGVFPGHAPIGYMNVEIHKGERGIAPDPNVFPVLTKLWNILKKDKPQLSALYHMMEENHPIFCKSDPSKKISSSTFYRIFHNKFYCGVFTWQGKECLGSHKTILTQSEFEDIQEHLNKKDKVRERVLDFDFKGLFECATCGAMITAERKTKYVKSEREHRNYDFYKCAHHKRGVKCEEKAMSKKSIEEEIYKEIQEIELPSEVIEEGKRCFSEEFQATRTTKSVNTKNLLYAITKLKQDIAQIKDNLCLESDSEMRYMMKNKLDEKKIQLQKLEEDYKAECTAPQNKLESLQNQLDIISDITFKFQNGVKRDRQLIINSIGSNWKIKDRELHYEPHFLIGAIQKAKNDLNIKLGSFEPSNIGHIGKKLTSEEVSFFWLDIWAAIRNSIL